MHIKSPICKNLYDMLLFRNSMMIIFAVERGCLSNIFPFVRVHIHEALAKAGIKYQVSNNFLFVRVHIRQSVFNLAE